MSCFLSEEQLLGDIKARDAEIARLRGEVAALTRERDDLKYREIEAVTARDEARVEAIEARHKAAECTSHAMGGSAKARNAREQLKMQDRCIERLKAEVERLRDLDKRNASLTHDAHQALCDRIVAVASERDQARAEADRLRRMDKSLVGYCMQMDSLKADLAAAQRVVGSVHAYHEHFLRQSPPRSYEAAWSLTLLDAIKRGEKP